MKFKLIEDIKEKQLELIQKYNPHNKNLNKDATWIRNIDDIKDSYEQAAIDDDTIETGITPDFTAADIKKAITTNIMTVWSSKPIEIGTFVTPSKMLAISYGNDKPYHKVIHLDEVAWIDSSEGQYIGNEI